MRENIFYANLFIMFIPAVNVLEHIESYQSVENEVKLIRPLYDLGIKKILAYINVRGDKNETFFN